jgi:hypothetical protein
VQRSLRQYIKSTTPLLDMEYLERQAASALTRVEIMLVWMKLMIEVYYWY